MADPTDRYLSELSDFEIEEEKRSEMTGNVRYTPTQQNILGVLSDGLFHDREELRLCLRDPESTSGAVRTHVCNLRKKLQPIGEDIVCDLSKGVRYRRVRLLASAVDGKR